MLPDRCRVTVFAVNARCGGPELSVASAEYAFGSFFQLGALDCPPKTCWNMFIRLWMATLRSAETPCDTPEYLFVSEATIGDNRFRSAEEDRKLARKNVLLREIVRNLPMRKKVIDDDAQMARDMMFDISCGLGDVVFRGGMNPLADADSDDDEED